MNKRKVVLAEAGILLVAMFWGMGFVAAKFVLMDMDPFNLLGYRYGFALIVMLIIGAKYVINIDKKTLKAGCVIGVIMFTGNIIQTIALQYTTPGKQTFITCMYTVIVPLMTWLFFKEKTSKKMIWAAVTAFVGIGFLTLQDNLTIGFGDALTFVFAITFSMHVILVGRFMKNMEPMSFAIVQIATCAVLSISTAAIFGGNAGVSNLSTGGVLGMAQLVFLNTVFAFILQNACQKIAPPAHTAVLMSTETVFGAFFAICFAGEIFSKRMIIGSMLMFLALIISNLPDGWLCRTVEKKI